MKKRLVCFMLGIVMCLMSIVGLFLPRKNSSEKQMASAWIEDELGEKIDIIGINPSSYSNATIENTAPFNGNIGAVLDGSSITPNADRYGQVTGATFAVNSFNLSQYKSIYLWVYLFDVETYELSFSISDAGENTCSWFFDSSKVESYGAGWSLLELKLSDCSKSASNTNILNPTYSTFSVAFKCENQENISQFGDATENFSFYHVYLAGRYISTQNSGKIGGFGRAYADFKDDFISRDQVFLGDTITFDNPYNVFDYIRVGKGELSENAAPTNFTWEIKVLNPDGSEITLDFGDTLDFSDSGYYSINIKLYEKQKLINQPYDFQKVMILNMSKNVFCEKMSLGKFVVGTTYEMMDNESLEIGFTFSSGIQISGDIKVEFDNKKAEVESQYEKDGIYYIKVKGIEKGTTVMTISASASSAYNSRIDTYESKTTIKILESNEDADFSMVILWITFGLFCAYFVGYLINSLVKARKNDVK